MRLGVIVARFQTPRLTQAHFALLQQVPRIRFSRSMMPCMP